MSEDGIGFVANQEFVLNERIFVVLLTPFGRVSTVARVVHLTPAGNDSYRLGVKLEVVPPTDKAVWATLVDREVP